MPSVINAHHLEDLRVFREAEALEAGFGELAPVNVARLVVEQPAQPSYFQLDVPM